MARLIITSDGLVEPNPAMLLEVDAEEYSVPIRKKPTPRATHLMERDGFTAKIPVSVAKQLAIKNWWGHRRGWKNHRVDGRLGKVHPGARNCWGGKLVEFVTGERLWV